MEAAQLWVQASIWEMLVLTFRPPCPQTQHFVEVGAAIIQHSRLHTATDSAAPVGLPLFRAPTALKPANVAELGHNSISMENPGNFRFVANGKAILGFIGNLGYSSWDVPTQEIGN